MAIDYLTGELDDPVSAMNVRRSRAAGVLKKMWEHLKEHPSDEVRIEVSSRHTSRVAFAVLTRSTLSPLARMLLCQKKERRIEKPEWHPFTTRISRQKTEKEMAKKDANLVAFFDDRDNAVFRWETWFSNGLGLPSGVEDIQNNSREELLRNFRNLCPEAVQVLERELLLERMGVPLSEAIPRALQAL